MENVREDRASANPNCKIGIAKKYKLKRIAEVKKYSDQENHIL